MPAWMFTTYPGELEVEGPPVSIILPADPKSQAEVWGEVDEEGGHLYKCNKILYEEDYHPKPVHTHGMADALALVSSLSPSCLNPKFHLCPSHLMLDYSKTASCLLLSECKGSPFTKWETPTTTREEDPNLDSILGQPSHYCWWGHSPGHQGTWHRCSGNNWSDHQPTWEAWRGNAQKFWESLGAMSPHCITPKSYIPYLASWMHLSHWWRFNIRDQRGERFLWELWKWIPWGLPPSLGFPRCESNPTLQIPYKDLVPMTRSFQTWLPISRAGWRHLGQFYLRPRHSTSSVNRTWKLQAWRGWHLC